MTSLNQPSDWGRLESDPSDERDFSDVAVSSAVVDAKAPN